MRRAEAVETSGVACHAQSAVLLCTYCTVHRLIVCTVQYILSTESLHRTTDSPELGRVLLCGCYAHAAPPEGKEEDEQKEEGIIALIASRRPEEVRLPYSYTTEYYCVYSIRTVLYSTVQYGR